MLSILIPVYNYDVLPLVLELKHQADTLGIVYEIIAQDDASGGFIDKNNPINRLENCSFFVNKENLGRGKNINSLAHKSKYDYVLIMEADALPEDKSYLKNYIDALTKAPKAIFGGVKYPDTVPPGEKLLRWKYGINREIKSLAYRLRNNYDFVFTWNLLLKKEILLQFPFPEFVNEYGYEDSIFIQTLRLNAISITHIENILVHHNQEDSIDFIKKTERAVENLHNLISSQKVDSKDIKLSKVYTILKKFHLTGVSKLIYVKNKNMMLSNLISKNAKLYVLDFYKLGYYCTLKTK